MKRLLSLIPYLICVFILSIGIQVAAGDREDCEKNDYNKCERFGTSMTTQRKRSEAMALFASLCEKHKDSACVVLSSWLKTQGEYQKGKRVLAEACKNGSHRACVEQLISFTPSKEEKKNGLERECDRNVFAACGALVFVIQGKHNSANIVQGKEISQQAKKLLEKACNGGESGSCYILSQYWKEAKKETLEKKFSSKMLEIDKKKCAKGDLHACESLAHWNEDHSEINRLLRDRCDLGDGTACTELEMAEHDLGYLDREKKARMQGYEENRAACEQGVGWVCKYTGRFDYAASKEDQEKARAETEKDEQRVHDVQVKGCDDGDNNMCYELEYNSADPKNRDVIVKKYEDTW